MPGIVAVTDDRTVHSVVVGRLVPAALALAMLMSGCALNRPLRSATGFTAHSLCIEAFVAGRPADAMVREHIDRAPGLRLLAPVMHYDVDAATRTVEARVFGSFRSRAQFADGRGCTLVHGSQPIAAIPAAQVDGWADPLAAPDAPVVPQDAGLAGALDAAFAETKGKTVKYAKAVVVVRDGKILAERYAPGFGPHSMFQSWSVAKSVTTTLIGLLVADGRLTLDAHASAFTQARGKNAAATITIDQLLRQTSGLPRQTGSGFDANSKMLFMTSDMAAFAARERLTGSPGTRWAYTDGNFAIVSRTIRDLAGGTPAAVAAFARQRLFAPLGMRSAILEFDQSGTPMGATHVVATARDWARFGLLYAARGTIADRQILPASWIDYVRTPTQQAELGYGAGFWTNAGPSRGALWRRAMGAPAESFFASGNFGQVILISPEQHLVIVRLGLSNDTSGRDSMLDVLRIAKAVPAPQPGRSP